MRPLDLTETYPTAHFMWAMEKRGVQWSEVATALRSPHVTEPHQGKWRYVRGSLVVVVADVNGPRPALVTCLLRHRQQWNDSDMKTRNR